MQTMTSKALQILSTLCFISVFFSFGIAQTPMEVAGTATITATSSGNWSASSTWGGDIPLDDDRVLIPSGITVTVDGMIEEEFKSVRIANGAKLQFATDVNTELRTEYLFSGMNGSFEMGNSFDKINPDVTASLVFAWRGGTTEDEDIHRFVPGAVLMGPVRMHGSDKSSWTTLTVHPEAGSDQLILDTNPSGWKVGDKLVVAGTDINDYTSDELVTINNISGNTINLSSPLTKNHLPPAQLTNMVDVHVSNTNHVTIVFFIEHVRPKSKPCEALVTHSRCFSHGRFDPLLFGSLEIEQIFIALTTC